MPNPFAALQCDHWQIDTTEVGLLTLLIDVEDAGANVLSGPVLSELAHILKLVPGSAIQGIVFASARPAGFIMGADINEFTRIFSEEDAYRLIRKGQHVINSIAALSVPTVALIDGFALGGGLELAMACDYRVAIDRDKAILGLPEVKLGIHPGFGGTVRAVQLMGVRQAMPMMLTGKSMRPKIALRSGLIDAAPKNPDEALRVARQLLKDQPALRKAPLLDRLLSLKPLRTLIASKLRADVGKKARPEHYPAPFAIVDLWKRLGARGNRAMDGEARSIAKLMVTEASRNLVRVFFLQNRLKRQSQGQGTKIEKVHVVGAGVMGGDIAAWCANRGLIVTLQDRELKYITPAIDRGRKLFEKRLKKPAAIEAATQRLIADVDGQGIADADLIIEAIYENLDAKKALYAEIEKTMKPSALIATNTSSIRLEELSVDLKQPSRLIGLHFFNPVAQLPLVEIVRTPQTEQQALDSGHQFVLGIAKTPLEVLSAPGFLVNRILAPYMGEAVYLADEGVSLVDIDDAAVEFGMPMGPVELADNVGLDVALHVAKILSAAFGGEVPGALETKVAAGELGKKSGRGFYVWANGKADKHGGQSGERPGDLTDRLILPMVNEAVACLAEGVVGEEELLDVGVIFGTGFAPFRGGPLQYARTRGLSEVRNRLEWLADRHGPRFAPKPGWDALIAESTGTQRTIIQK